jgi:energy-coupling factor transporter transmembrane protein EcfT
MILYYLLTIIVFITALITGIKKGKKRGYTIFGFLGIIMAVFTFSIFRGLSETLTVQALGKPELLGQNLGSLLAMALATSIALGIYTILFMLIKFNKKGLAPEACCLVTSVIIAISSIQLTGTLSSMEEKYSYPYVSVPQATHMVIFK